MPVLSGNILSQYPEMHCGLESQASLFCFLAPLPVVTAVLSQLHSPYSLSHSVLHPSLLEHNSPIFFVPVVASSLPAGGGVCSPEGVHSSLQVSVHAAWHLPTVSVPATGAVHMLLVHVSPVAHS